MPQSAARPEPNGRHCLQCGKPLVGKQLKFCTRNHKQAWHHAQRNPAGIIGKALTNSNTSEVVAAEVNNLVTEVVREQLTADVLRAIGKAVEHLPKAIETLVDIMESDNADPDQKRQAASTLLRYTMGNTSVAPPSVEEDKAPLQVTFNVPGGELPGGKGVAPPPDAEAHEQHECVECHLWKDWPEEFVGQSDRCCACNAALKQRLESQYGPIKLG